MMAETETKVPSEAPKAAPAPSSPFDTLRREIDRVFENFGLDLWKRPHGSGSMEFNLQWPHASARGLAPAVDVAEKDQEFEITAELPGLDEKDVEVKVANGMLTIRGEKKEEKEERQKDYFLSERRFGSFVRSFGLPAGVDPDKIEAHFAKGVLTVRLPKTAEARNEKKIAVTAA